MLFSYVLEDLLHVVNACSRGGICSTVPMPRMSMITIGSFLSYRDAIQLHASYLTCSSAAMPGWLNYDHCLSSIDVEYTVSPHGIYLGCGRLWGLPRGSCMPSPIDNLGP